MNISSSARKLITKLRMRLGLAQEPPLPELAKLAMAKDATGLPEYDPGIATVVRESTNWLIRAQHTPGKTDNGVSRHYSLVSGWGPSYPETSGYIVPTLLDQHRATGDAETLKVAIEILDWFLDIQFPDGGFQGGTIDATHKVPVTFNTGQILLGLAAAAEMGLGGRYNKAMHQAAIWLRDSQDDDGAWRRHPTPFAAGGDKAYETHVAWGLLEAARIAPKEGYAQSALRNIHWALTCQLDNGWFENCCLNQPRIPLTHTIGYVVRGLLEGWRYTEDPALLKRACITLDAVINCVDSDGRLPGRLDVNWQPAANWVCLTGSSQLAHCLLMVHEATGRKGYLDTAQLLNSFVRRTISIDGSDNIRGAVKGSFPVDGEYGRFEYLNWAAKFTIDANMLEQKLITKSP